MSLDFDDLQFGRGGSALSGELQTGRRQSNEVLHSLLESGVAKGHSGLLQNAVLQILQSSFVETARGVSADELNGLAALEGLNR
jgi:hypothetical protein